MKSNSAALLAVAAAVVLAGCLGFPQGQIQPTTADNGVIIKSFSPDFTEVRGGEQISFLLSVENVGEADANAVKAQLFGLNFAPNEWDDLTPDETQTVDLLRRADPSAGVTGDIYDFTWGVKAPSLTVDNTYTADARVHFKYTTSAVSILRFVTNDYLKSLPTEQAEQVRKTAGVISTKVSGAPISVSMSVGARPLIVYSGGERFTLSIIVSNVGSGNAFSDAASYPPVQAGDLHKVKVTITKDAAIDIDCSTVFGDDKKTEGTVVLTRGKSKTMSCSVTSPSKEDIDNTKDFTVSVDLSYGYFVDSSTNIKVLKTEQVTGVTGDTDAPTRSGHKPTGTITGTKIAMVLKTNEAATCKYSTTAGVVYDSMAQTFTMTGSTTHGVELAGLSEGAKNYYVKCADSSGNKNTDDLTISFTVAAGDDTTAPVTIVKSVEEDATEPYEDTTNDGNTDVVVFGESKMTCRWYDTDVNFDAASGTACSTSGSEATCVVAGATGSVTKYIACTDGNNGQTKAQNLAVSWTVK